MKALVHTKPFGLEYVDVNSPVRKEGEVLIKIASVGICGSDIHGYSGESGRRIPPIIMGHEASGIVTDVGENSRFNPGDRVCVDSTIYCGLCEFCIKQKVNLCSDRKVIGVSCEEYYRDGAMAEYISVPERIVYKINDSISMDDAALIEPASVAYHSISLSQFNKDDTIMVVGAGIIGLSIIQVLKMRGCNEIISVDINDSRLDVAKFYGADYLINPQRENKSQKINKGVDIAFEAVGINSTVNYCIDSVKKSGKVILVGNVQQNVTFPLQKIVTRELIILGSCAISGEYPEVIRDLTDGKINFDKIVTSTASLSHGKQWFDELSSGKHNQIKVILNP